MIVELKKNKEKPPKKLSKNGLRNLIREMIDEMWSSFPNQYDIAKVCADAFVEMLKAGEMRREIEYKSGPIEKITIVIKNGNYLINTDIDFDKGNVIISLVLNNWVGRTKQELYEAIALELMHGNTFLSRYNNISDKEKIEDTPGDYRKLLELYGDYPYSTAGRLAYAMYSCYYQETQAIISQTYSSIKKEYNERGLKVITKRTFRTLLRDSTPWQIFSGNIEDCCNVIDGMSQTDIEKNIIRIYKIYGIEINLKTLSKEIKRIRKVSNEALIKCMKNSTFFYNELKEKKLIKL